MSKDKIPSTTGIVQLQEQPVKSSFFDEFLDDRKEYEFDAEKFWIPFSEFQALEKEFPYFSKNPLIEGILFKKSKKTAWFRNKFYILYQDRLVYYKGDSQYPDKVMLLRGVTLHLAEDVIEMNEMDVKLTIEDIEKRSFIFTRNKNFCIISPGTKEHHARWLEGFKNCVIFTNFSKYYKIIRPIAKGTFAKVLECQRISDGKTFAVKTLEKSNILNSLSAVRSKIGLINEINILRRLDHPNLIRLFEVYEGKYNIYLVMENLKGGELFNEIVKNGNMSEKITSIILLQLLRALDYIHAKGFVHRDIKLENMIFVNEGTLDIKVADFGLSESLSKKKCLFKRCGTPGYVAPEVLSDKDYSYKCDIFSAGIVLFILLTGYSPFYAATYQEILLKNKACNINFDVYEQFGVKLSEQAIHLLKWLLDVNPENRPTAKEAMNHIWFLSQMTPEEKKHHQIILRNQANLIKHHELKIQPKIIKKSKSIELLMKSPEFYVPFDQNAIQSPIMTPDIVALKFKQPAASDGKTGEEEKKNEFGNKELCVSVYEDEEAKDETKKGNNSAIDLDTDSNKLSKKYFSSSDLVFSKEKTKNQQKGKIKN